MSHYFRLIPVDVERYLYRICVEDFEGEHKPKGHACRGQTVGFDVKPITVFFTQVEESREIPIFLV